jgi:hypothetical protein
MALDGKFVRKGSEFLNKGVQEFGSVGVVSRLFRMLRQQSKSSKVDMPRFRVLWAHRQKFTETSGHLVRETRASLESPF